MIDLVSSEDRDPAAAELRRSVSAGRGNMIKFDDQFDITLKVSDTDDMSQTWHASDFTSGNGYTVTRTFHTESLGNNVTYTVKAKQIAHP